MARTGTQPVTLAALAAIVTAIAAGLWAWSRRRPAITGGAPPSPGPLSPPPSPDAPTPTPPVDGTTARIERIRALCRERSRRLTSTDRAILGPDCPCPPTVRQTVTAPQAATVMSSVRAVTPLIAAVPPSLGLAIVAVESDFNAAAHLSEPCVWALDVVDNDLYTQDPFRLDCCAWGSWGLTQMTRATALGLNARRPAFGLPRFPLDVHPSALLGTAAGARLALELMMQLLTEGYAKDRAWEDAITRYNSGRPRSRLPVNHPTITDYLPRVLRFWRRYEGEGYA